MNTKFLLLIPVAVLFGICFEAKSQAKNVNNIESSLSDSILIKCESESTNGYSNFKNFKVSAPSNSNYYVKFWLLPAKYENGSYTNFKVYVNGQYIGNIKPSTGDWQSAEIDGIETIALNKGENVISIATAAPEVPKVESVKLASNFFDASFSDEQYKDFIRGVKSGLYYKVSVEDNYLSSVNTASEINWSFFNNLPLMYTFYNTFSFTQGQDIFISSSSLYEHNLDIVYYGTPIINDSNKEGSIFFKKDFGSKTENQSISISFPSIKPTTFYKVASSEEMQGLNWIARSEKTINSKTYVATTKIMIPKDGIYLIRLRTKESGSTALADLNVNGLYYYEDVPMSFTGIQCVMPADGHTYACMTRTEETSMVDPFLFIHGAGADRIVGFNDDAATNIVNDYALSCRDSYIQQKYFVSTSGISVSNFSSLNPVGECTLVARMFPSEMVSPDFMKAISNKSPLQSSVSDIIEQDCALTIVSDFRIGSMVKVLSTEDILRISVYAVDGVLKNTRSVDNDSLYCPLSELGVAIPGVYVLFIETSRGVSSKKIIVR
ncbi:MAG: hypothetical protein NC131_11275 [Roseburia sp.]|nr:hypothetical protein [Roseburia sp.]